MTDKTKNTVSSDVIFTRVFEGTRYLHHVCSECGCEIKFEQHYSGGVYFYELYGVEIKKFKFCPNCGGEIVRISDKAIFIEPISLEPLEVFAELHREFERKARWIYHCYISEDHRDKVDTMIPLLESGKISVYYDRAIHFAKVGKRYSCRWTERKKLIKEFGNKTEEKE